MTQFFGKEKEIIFIAFAFKANKSDFLPCADAIQSEKALFEIPFYSIAAEGAAH